MPYVDPVVYPPLFADGAVDTYVLFSGSTRPALAAHAQSQRAPQRTTQSYAHTHRKCLEPRQPIDNELTYS